jgi:hypothetical protein
VPGLFGGVGYLRNTVIIFMKFYVCEVCILRKYGLLNNLHYSLNIISANKTRKVRCAKQVASKRQNRNSYKFGKSDVKKRLERQGLTFGDNNKTDLREIRVRMRSGLI